METTTFSQFKDIPEGALFHDVKHRFYVEAVVTGGRERGLENIFLA